MTQANDRQQPAVTTPTAGVRARGRREWCRLLKWPVIGGLVVFSLALGWIGFRLDAAARGVSLSPWEASYRSLQMFVLESESDSPALPWQAQLARFLAPALAGYAAIQALLLLFRAQFDLVRVARWRRHVVVCGLGRVGPFLVRDLLRQKQRVVVIEHDGANPHLAEARDLGAVAFVGDAADPGLLRRAGVTRARHLVTVTGQDGLNVEVALRAYELMAGVKRAAEDALVCHAHVVNPGLYELFRKHRVFSNPHVPFQIDAFSIYSNAARLLFQAHPLDRCGMAPADPRRAHLIMLGFGPSGESVVLQAAKLGHFANGQRLRVTVVDQAADRIRECFALRYPNFDKTCDAEFRAGDLECADAYRRVVEDARDPGSIVTVVVAFADDFDNLSHALRLARDLRDNDVPILVRMTHDAGVAALLEAEGADRELHNVHGFGMVQQTASAGAVLNVGLDRMASAIHEDFRRQRKAKREPIKPEVDRPWACLDETYQDSNRQQADHIPVKLRAIGCLAAPVRAGAEPVTEFTPDEVELLARMEHARWNADRWLDGWTLGPRDDAHKTHPNLVPWDELPTAIQDYDRAAVRQIPALVGLDGGGLYPANEATAKTPRSPG